MSSGLHAACVSRRINLGIELYSLSSLRSEHGSPPHDPNMHPNSTHVLEYDHATLV